MAKSGVVIDVDFVELKRVPSGDDLLREIDQSIEADRRETNRVIYLSAGAPLVFTAALYLYAVFGQ